MALLRYLMSDARALHGPPIMQARRTACADARSCLRGRGYFGECGCSWWGVVNLPKVVRTEASHIVFIRLRSVGRDFGSDLSL